MCQFGGVYWRIENIEFKEYSKDSDISEDNVEKMHTIISQSGKNT
ncbi:MAG: hypothetical protein ACQERB_01180 [Promethearchaeati archaeon]